MTKLRGVKRWDHKDDQRDLLAGEILADSLNNAISYYFKKRDPIPAETLAKWEIQSSKILGVFRSILGRAKWTSQIQLKRWVNPAPNQAIQQEGGR